MKVKTVLILLAFLPMQSIAAPVWHTSTIKSIYPHADGNFVIIFNQDSPSCTSTAGASDYYYVGIGQNGVTAGAIDKMYAAALAAGMGGKSVTINFDDSTTACYINRLTVDF